MRISDWSSDVCSSDLYRDADVHFFLIEALNNLGLFTQAEALLNDGVELYLSLNAGNLEYPFDDPVINQAIVRNWGIRRRVNLYPVYPEGKSKDELETEADMQAYMTALDSLVARSEASRVGKQWVSPCIYRWWPCN